MFLAAQSGDLFVGRRSSHKGYTEIFPAYLVTSSLIELLVAKNIQKNFQKFWFQRVSQLTLATCSRLKSVVKIACFAQFGQFLKCLGFPSNILCLFIVFPDRTSLKPTVFLTKTSIVAHLFIFNLLEKGMGFSILSLYFMFIVVFS